VLRQTFGVAQARGLAHTAGDAPVTLELGLRLRGQRAFGDEAEIQPRRLAHASDEVFVGDVAPAAPQARAISDHQLAVVAQVGTPASGKPQRRHEAARVHARGPEQRIVAVRAFQAADAVDQQAHAHAGAGAFGQQRGHLGADLVIAQNVSANVQRAGARCDQRAQLFERSLAIGGKAHRRLRAGPGDTERRQQARGPQRRRMRPGPGRLGLAARGRPNQLARAEDQEQRQAEVGKGRDSQYPRHRGVRVAPLTPHARDHDVGQKPCGHEGAVLQRGERGQVQHGCSFVGRFDPYKER